MPLILPGNVASATAGAFEVANSCRCNSGDDPSMTRTLGSDGNTDKFTISMWVKRGKLGVQGYLCGASPGGSNDFHINFESDDTLRFYQNTGGSVAGKLQTNRKFRDPSAWYHLVFVWDTGNATAGNRMRMYVNGTEETSFGTDTNPAEDAEAMWLDAASPMYVMAYDTGSSPVHFDGYIAEFVCCDGQAYAASDFGEFSEDSPTIWMPKDVSSLTFGTNGWYFDFEDSSNLGNDANGGTDWSEANLAAADQATDTPTNNFATWNPLVHAATAGTFSEGNCIISPGHDTSRVYTVSTLAMPVKTGSKWYAEFKVDANDTGSLIGVLDARFISDVFQANTDVDSNSTRTDMGRVVYRISTGEINYPSSQSTDSGVTSADNDIISVALDAGGGKVYFAKNGTWMNSADPAAGSNGEDVTGQGWWTTGVDEFVFLCGDGSTGAYDNWEAHFGGCPAFAISSANADDAGYGNFEYDVPAGFYALCTKNLAEYG